MRLKKHKQSWSSGLETESLMARDGYVHYILLLIRPIIIQCICSLQLRIYYTQYTILVYTVRHSQNVLDS